MNHGSGPQAPAAVHPIAFLALSFVRLPSLSVAQAFQPSGDPSGMRYHRIGECPEIHIAVEL